MGVVDHNLSGMSSGFRGAFCRLQADQAATSAELIAARAELRGALRLLHRVSRDLDSARRDIRLLKSGDCAAATATQVLRRTVPATQCPPQLLLLRDEVCARTGIPVALICGPRRFAPLVAARAEFAHQARAMGATVQQIGQALGYRDHSTVVSLLAKARAGQVGGAA